MSLTSYTANASPTTGLFAPMYVRNSGNIMEPTVARRNRKYLNGHLIKWRKRHEPHQMTGGKGLKHQACMTQWVRIEVTDFSTFSDDNIHTKHHK